MTDEKNLSTFEEGSEDFAAMFAAQEAGTVRLQSDGHHHHHHR